MCGICGIFHPNREVTERGVRAMNAAQAHRGPDDEGMESFTLPGGNLTLGQRRLAILDLSPAGHQPMTNPNTGDWIVFNGEIYNFPQLRQELAASGARFHSRCDTEVILHAYARWGTACFDRLHGMFALALYDRAYQRLILARDPLGIKPLYYAVNDEAVLFASELRALMVSGLLPMTVDRRALASLLAYGAVPQPLTMYQEVQQLEPGTWLAFDLTMVAGSKQTIQPTCFWEFPNPQPTADRAEAVETLRARLTFAVQSHLMSDVPIGIFLSSGLDSSSVATLAAETSADSLNTFTVSLADHAQMDENLVAVETARLLNVCHHTITLTEAEVLAQTERFLTSVDQPTVDGLNTFIIANVVRRQEMKVALSGLGGDELFGGYSTFYEMPSLVHKLPWLVYVPAGLRSHLAGLLFAGKSKAQCQKARELVTTRPTLRNLYFRRRRLFSDLEMQSFGLRADDLSLNEDFIPPEAQPDQALPDDDPQAAISILESRFYMGNMLLRDADVFGMAHGLEIRVPLLDRTLVDYGLTLPGAWRVRQGQINKPLLTDAMAEKLNPQLRALPKQGFSLPQAAWMAGPLRAKFEYLLQVVKDSNLVADAAVAAVWQDFLADQVGPTWSRAWLLGVLGAWLDVAENLKRF